MDATGFGANAATGGNADWSQGHLQTRNPTPSGLSVGRPGGPRGPELMARHLADRKIMDGIVGGFEQRERSAERPGPGEPTSD